MIDPKEYVDRLNQLRNKIRQAHLDAFLVSQSESIYYFTGASYKAQERPFLIVVWPDKEPTFVVPKLEESHMEKAHIGDVRAYWEFPSPQGLGWPETLMSIFAGVKDLGIEPGISVENQLKISWCTTHPVPLVENLRLIKSATELDMIRQSAKYADFGMELMLKNAYYGVSVLEMFSLGRKIQMAVIKTGEFDPLNCEFLTATWPAPFSAKPHGIPPTNGRLREGPLAAMSYLRVNGYAAECERTFFLSPPTPEVIEMFDTMREARQVVFQLLKPGTSCGDVDKAAMDYLKSAGYGQYLLHRTGHGLGQNNHEGPWVAEGSEHVLAENMLISVEPGIYHPDIGGFRHSDTVLITKRGFESLTKYPQEREKLTILKKKSLKRLTGKIIRMAVGM